MYSILFCWIFCILLASAIHQGACTEGFGNWYRQDIRQAIFIKDESHYLSVARVKTQTVNDIFDCIFGCLGNPFCVSLNVAAFKGANGKFWCELLSSEKYSEPEEYKENSSSHHFSIKSPCLPSSCLNGGTCLANYKHHTFKCICTNLFAGKHCETATEISCKDVYDKHKLNVTQVVPLLLDSKQISVRCHVGDFGCGDGGWTPVMKMNGTKQTFHYNSPLWSNKETFNLPGGESGFDANETKLPSYWNTSFTKICLGMKINQQVNYIVINKQASSLFALIADGEHSSSSIGRNKWKSIVGSQASLQDFCNREGFNVVCTSSPNQARIGILGNNENACSTCDSRIGFGTGGYPDDSSTCGNNAKVGSDNGDRAIKALGFILVQ